MRYGFVIDQDRCIGCHACTVACKEEHQVPLGVFRTWVKYIEKGEFPNTNTVDLRTTAYVGLTYQFPLTLDTRKASLTRRTAPNANSERIAGSDWAFADCGSTPFPGKPDLTKLCIKGGFNPALAYTLAFTAKNPKVFRIGRAATRA